MNHLIAPCGMNCALCQAYQGIGLHCLGCGNSTFRKSCQNCTIKNCSNKVTFCFECSQYPCKRLKQLDKRYRSKYGMSMIENLNTIKTIGIDEFVNQQNLKYRCNRCGNLKSVHRTECIYCSKIQNL